MSRAEPTDWLPSDEEDSVELFIPWPTSSPPPASPESSDGESSASSIAPFDSGQRIDSSDPGVDRTSPIIGDQDQREAARRSKAVRKRRTTMELNKQAQEAAQAEIAREAAEQAAREDAERRARLKQQQDEQRATCFRVLRILKDTGISLGTFLLCVLAPDATDDDIRQRRWNELFRDPTIVHQLLGFWTTSAETPPSVRHHVNSWMVSHVARLATLESRRITADGWMRWPAGGMSKQDILDFELGALYPRFEATAPVTLEILSGFSTSRQQARAPSGQMKHRKRTILTQVIAILLREHSRQNDLVASYNGLYLYATGAQRQTISVLSHSGWSCSYPKLVQKSIPAKSDNNGDENVGPLITQGDTPGVTPNPTQAVGIIPELSSVCLEDARKLATTGRYKTTYDNVNFTDGVAEQIFGRKDAQINMTNATAAPLHTNDDKFDVDEALSLDAAENAFQSAPELDFSDLVFTPEEAKVWDSLLVHTTEEIIVDRYAEGFARFRTHLEASRPRDEHQIKLHKTALYPLQTMDIDEALITGNIEVVDEIHLQLGVDLNAPECSGKVRLFFGDQLTIARQRSIIAARAGHDRGAESWRWAKPVLGLFHTDMAAVSCIVANHYGKPGTGTRNPGSLWFHNTVLDRKPIVLTSLPPYHVCRDLITVSLYARVLHCLLLVSQEPDLQSCSASILTWDQLHSYAQDICKTYASTRAVSKLRRERTSGATGDLVFENAVLFLRDALGLRTFSRAVKTGRSGHIVLALKWLALMFRAGGHTKYAREMLFLLHHLAHVWPPKLKELVLSNWLVNPTGTKDGWVALDLMQEHLNFWIKRIYAAHGSNASWEWLAMISPCIEVLRGVANNMHRTLGSYQGSKHTSPDLTRDINELMKSLQTHSVYTQDEKRVSSKEDVVAVTDLLTEGFQQMLHGPNASLSEYNVEFRTLQSRCRVVPLQPYENEAVLAGGDSAGVQATDSAFQAASGGLGGRSTQDRAQMIDSAAPESRARSSGMNARESNDGMSDVSSNASNAESSSTDEYREYDELFLRLLEEQDVELDPEGTWQEAEGSDDEQEPNEEPDEVDSD